MKNVPLSDFDYSIIIPAYNEAAELPETLRSVSEAMAGCRDRGGEVIVVDNASTDATAALARAAGALVVPEPEHCIARVRNTGARAARGRCLIFLDADTVMPAELLAAVLAALDGGGVCGGGTAVEYKGRTGRFARRLVSLWALISRRKKWAAGSFLFCLRQAFEAVGGFDERVYYSEEVILSEALGRWGRKHGMRFEILSIPVYTSPRKFEWFSKRHIALSLLLAPFWRRSKARASLWYTRPDQANQ